MYEDDNAKILEKLIDEDFGIEYREGSRWGKAVKHDSLVLDREKGIFYFNSKHIVGVPLTYLMDVRGMSFQQAREYLSKYKYVDTFSHTINTETGDIVVYPKLVDIFYDSGRSSDRRVYWYSRGINDTTIDIFRLGWYNGFSTVPIYMDGSFRQFQLRMDGEKRQIRNFYRGVGPLLFNSDVLKVVDDVYITEGLTDCLRLGQEGIPSVSHNTGAGGWQEQWYKYFLHQKNIYVIFDNDQAGKSGAKKVAKNLGIYRTKIFNFSGYEDKYDVVNFFQDGGTRKEFIELVKNRSKYLFELEDNGYKNKR